MLKQKLNRQSHIVSHNRAGPPLRPRLLRHFPGSPSLGNWLPVSADVDPKSWAGVVNFCCHISMNFIPFIYSGNNQYLGSQRAGKEGRVVGCYWLNPAVLGEATWRGGRTHSTTQKGTSSTAYRCRPCEMVAPFCRQSMPPTTMYRHGEPLL